MPSITLSQYGKTRVRLTQVLRNNGKHEVVELSLVILFEGKFDESYANADNSKVLPTDTMKNTVYVLARQNPITSIEEFGLSLGRHFLKTASQLDQVRVKIEQRPWVRIQDHASAFLIAGQQCRTASVLANRAEEKVTAGVKGLEILKTANSAFSGYLKDELTTLPETRDRLLGTVLDVDWTYKSTNVNFEAEYEAIQATLLGTFAHHVSESVQHTLYDMATAALGKSTAISEIHLVMPNKHRLLFNLDRFGLDNPNQIFVPTDEPSGFIEARIAAT